MAKIAKDSDRPRVTHLVTAGGVSMCGAFVELTCGTGELTCPKCAAMATHALEGSTKAERKAWRKLFDNS